MEGFLGFLLFIYPLPIILLWVGLTWLLHRLFRLFKPRAHKGKGIYILTGIMVFSAWYGWAFWEFTGKKMYWDYQVRQMCANDGGVKVYETVILPPTEYEDLVSHGLSLRIFARSSIPYYEESEEHLVRKYDPEIYKNILRVIRRSDGKVLGEIIWYRREGGDLPGNPFPSSGFNCLAAIPHSVSFAESVFLKEKIK